MKRNPYPKDCRVITHRCSNPDCVCQSGLPERAQGHVLRVNRETLHVRLPCAYAGVMTQDVLIGRETADAHLDRTDKPAPRRK